MFNIYFTDVFLGGRFLRYGTQVRNNCRFKLGKLSFTLSTFQVVRFYMHSHAERRDLPNPMCTVFPTVTR